MTAAQAVWIAAKGELGKVGPNEVRAPGSEEVLVKNAAISINPVDWKIRQSGYFVKEWPVILGQDLAGTVEQTGEGVTHVKKGDRVLAHPLSLITGDKSEAGFQSHTVVRAVATTLIPDSIKFEEAAVIPLALSTAAAGLYESNALALPLPSHSPKESGKTLLLWGGSTSVGSMVIQLAVASGVQVIATASQRNHDYCKKLGAKEVYDYSSSTILQDLLSALKGKQVVGVYDAIGEGDSLKHSADLLSQLGGGHIASVLEPPKDMPKGVTVNRIFAPSIFNTEVGKAVYQDFLPLALKSGQLVPAPRPKVVGHGLEHVQSGMDELQKGVSATKLVVTL